MELPIFTARHHETIADHLEYIAKEMRAGTWRSVDLAVLAFRDAEDHNIVTLLPWSEDEVYGDEVGGLALSAARHYTGIGVN